MRNGRVHEGGNADVLRTPASPAGGFRIGDTLMKQIAITGAAGLVGRGLRKELRAKGYGLVLLDRQVIGDAEPFERAVQLDIEDAAGLRDAFAGVDTIVHLAACTTDAPWDEQVSGSVVGCINVFEAARAAGVPRVVYASSHHVVGLHPREPVMGTEALLRPDSRYGVGKAFGEALGAFMALKYGLKVLAIRIGNVNTRPIDRRRLGNWLSWRDLGQLVRIGIEHPDITFDVVYGISDASGRHYDNRIAHALGYRPQDTSEGWDTRVLEEDPPPPFGSPEAELPAEVTLGGAFSQAEYIGGTERLRRNPARVRS